MDKSVRILLADDNWDFIEVLKLYINGQEDMELVGAAYNGIEALELIKNESPDVVILDMVMPHLDGLGVLEKLQYNEQRPRVIILSTLGQESVTRQAKNLGADYYIQKPFDLDILGNRIREVYRDHTFISSPGSGVVNGAIVQPETSSKNLEVEVTELMYQMGVPTHVKGFRYLRDAIICSAKEVSLLDTVTRELYPMIAEKYHTDQCRVERGIRYAIELACDKGNVEFVNRFFGYTVNVDRGKPTNLEFIAMVVDKLKMPQLE